MNADAQQQPGEVNILHRSVGAFILIVLILVLLKGLLREQQAPMKSVEDFASTVIMPTAQGGYQSTVQLGNNRQVLNSIRVPVKIGGNAQSLSRKSSAGAKNTPASKLAPQVSAQGAARKAPPRVSPARSKKLDSLPLKSQRSGQKIPQRVVKTQRATSSEKQALKKADRVSLRSRTKKAVAVTTPARSRKKALAPATKARSGLKSATVKKTRKSANKRGRTVARAGKALARNTPVGKASVSKAPASKTLSKRAGWVVQIGLYSAKANAIRVQKDLRKRGYPVRSMPMKMGKGMVTRLWVGPYKKRSAAAWIKKKIITIARYQHSFVASNPLQRKQ